MHDIGDILMPANHAELGATILKPYVSEANHWMMEQARRLPGLLLLPLPGPGPRHARAVPRPSALRILRPVLPPLRPEQLRSGLRHHAAGGLRADAAAGDRGAEALDLPREEATASASSKIASIGMVEQPGDLEGQRQARVVLAGLDGVDALTRDVEAHRPGRPGSSRARRAAPSGGSSPVAQPGDDLAGAEEHGSRPRRRARTAGG